MEKILHDRMSICKIIAALSKLKMSISPIFWRYAIFKFLPWLKIVSPNQVLTRSRTSWRGCFAFTAVARSARGLWLEQEHCKHKHSRSLWQISIHDQDIWNFLKINMPWLKLQRDYLDKQNLIYGRKISLLRNKWKLSNGGGQRNFAVIFLLLNKDK